jgi:biopolymer transport protein ExbD
MSRYGRGSRRRLGVLAEDVSLQITSMADVFMILLVFLLKTYTTSVSSIVPPQGMKLPTTGQSEKIVEALKIEVSDGAIRLDGNPIVQLTDYKFKAEDISRDGYVEPLKTALAREKSDGKRKGEGELLVLADQRTPYPTLKTVLNTAAMGGWRDFKLVVVENQ